MLTEPDYLMTACSHHAEILQLTAFMSQLAQLEPNAQARQTDWRLIGGNCPIPT